MYVALVRFRPGAICVLSVLLVLTLLQGFFSRFSDFPSSCKSNISKFQFDQDGGASSLNIVIQNFFIYFVLV